MEIPKGWDMFDPGDINALHVVCGEWDEILVNPEKVYEIQAQLRCEYSKAFEMALQLEESCERALINEALGIL